MHALAGDRERQATSPRGAAERQHFAPCRWRGGAEAGKKIGPRHRDLTRCVDRQRPNAPVVAIAGKRRPDEKLVLKSGKIIERQETVCGCDFAAEGMIEHDEVERLGELWNRVEFKPRQRALRPADLDVGTLAGERFGCGGDRRDGAAMTPVDAAQHCRHRSPGFLDTLESAVKLPVQNEKLKSEIPD